LTPAAGRGNMGAWRATSVVWYLVGVPLIAAIHCSAWLWLFGEAFKAGERPSAPSAWSRWYFPRVLLLAVLRERP
jgi:hypothetical protein